MNDADDEAPIAIPAVMATVPTKPAIRTGKSSNSMVDTSSSSRSNSGANLPRTSDLPR
jgi:hypothetical protein